ncbi:MAG: twin-arginine translocation signal domain-containing protein [Bacteroidota bacterium]
METNDFRQANPRRAFLGKIAAGLTAMGLTSYFPFQALAKPTASFSPAGSADEWFGKIKGKHRMVFDATHPHEVFPFAWPKVFLMTNEKTGTPPSECGVVVVLRHSAIGYAMENKLWEKYKLGEVFEAQDQLTKKPATRNPFWQPKEGDFKIPGVGNVQIGINELQANGVMFCVCEMAMTVYSAAIAQQTGGDAVSIKKEFLAGILPDIQVVPSGVWALGRAQQQGCGYCFTG